MNYDFKNEQYSPVINTKRMFLDECPDGLVAVCEGKIREFSEDIYVLEKAKSKKECPEVWGWLIKPLVEQKQKELNKFVFLKKQLVRVNKKEIGKTIDVVALKSRINIVDFINGYTKLQNFGNKFRGLCPFHNEKTPSFFVDSEKGFYHCFGCGAGGDVITFVIKIEEMDFKEAINYLNKY